MQEVVSSMSVVKHAIKYEMDVRLNIFIFLIFLSGQTEYLVFLLKRNARNPV